MDLVLVLTIDILIRIQEDFDEFSDVEDLYSTFPMEKVEALEDMVSFAPSILINVSCELLIESTGKLSYVLAHSYCYSDMLVQTISLTCFYG